MFHKCINVCLQMFRSHRSGLVWIEEQDVEFSIVMVCLVVHHRLSKHQLYHKGFNLKYTFHIWIVCLAWIQERIYCSAFVYLFFYGLLGVSPCPVKAKTIASILSEVHYQCDDSHSGKMSQIWQTYLWKIYFKVGVRKCAVWDGCRSESYKWTGWMVSRWGEV